MNNRALSQVRGFEAKTVVHGAVESPASGEKKARRRYLLAGWAGRGKIVGVTKSADDYRHLSIPERLALVEAIWDTIAEDAPTLPLTAEQRAELDRRWAEHEADPNSAIPWEQVRDELYRQGE